jgi:hypothetical protein
LGNIIDIKINISNIENINDYIYDKIYIKNRKFINIEDKKHANIIKSYIIKYNAEKDTRLFDNLIDKV